MSYALITGASKGIGRAIAKELASRNINVLLVARSENLLASLAGEIERNYKVQCHYFVADLSTPDSPDKIYNWCVTLKYPVNILVNNAGYGLSGSFDSRLINEHVDLINVGMLSTIKLIHLFLPHLRQHPKGYILNIGSSAAYQAVPYLATYAATKAFIVSFSRALKYELRNSNVNVSVVNPGVTDTNFSERASVPEKGLKTAEKIAMQPEQVAKLAVNSMFSRKAEVVTGFITRLTVMFVKLLPKRFSEKTAAKFYQ
ncbi:MAG TPA: SDR family oxidoreductase [Flavisolibacter sp.]|jgi:short-subunit dehydrogenase|nr:SDR family oxidoreductase [Flavisolibacter sp.]